MRHDVASPGIVPVNRVSLTDQVFDRLYSRVMSLDLPPGSKLSEAEVAKQLQVSRQVVRDAFYRLSSLGFLVIRPQRATEVSAISVSDIREARYVRMALEMENVRHACQSFQSQCLEAMERLIDEQQVAIENGKHELFHELDNAFHKEMCAGAGLAFTYPIILEKKAHTDRVRFLSVAFSAQKALDGHKDILEAIKNKDTDRAVEAVRDHLSQIESAIDHLRSENHAWFEDS